MNIFAGPWNADGQHESIASNRTVQALVQRLRDPDPHVSLLCCRFIAHTLFSILIFIVMKLPAFYFSFPNVSILYAGRGLRRNMHLNLRELNFIFRVQDLWVWYSRSIIVDCRAIGSDFIWSQQDENSFSKKVLLAFGVRSQSLWKSMFNLSSTTDVPDIVTSLIFRIAC